MGNNVNLNITGSVEVGSGDGNVEMNSENKSIGIKERLTSKGLWMAVFGLVSLILEATGVFGKLGITDESLHAIITAFGAVLSAFGIVNNPTDKERI